MVQTIYDTIIIIVILISASGLTTNGQQVGVSLKLQGVLIPNNSLVDLDDLLYRTPMEAHPTNADSVLHDNALLCITDLIDCCGSPHTDRGDWFYPDGRAVMNTIANNSQFQANRGPNEIINGRQFYGSIRLWHQLLPPERGQFRCELPSASNPSVNQTLYIYLFNFGKVFISSDGSETIGATYALICSSTLADPDPLPSGVPPPTFHWYFGPTGDAPLPLGVMPTATMLSGNYTYNSILAFSALNQSHSGMYTCRLGAGSLAASTTIMIINGVHLFLKGIIYANNSVIAITEIGESDPETTANEALQCISDRRPCCANPPHRVGEWYFPNGSIVSRQSSSSSFYRSRNDNGVINLNRVHTNIISPVGRFCCQVPDSANVLQNLCAYIISLQLTGSVGTPTAGEIYSLTCTVSGADLSVYMTSYQWRKDGYVLAGETAVALSFSPFRLSHAGQYTCEVTVEDTMFSVTREIVAASVPVAGCPHDVDTTWGIAWPNTPQGSSSIQICPGSLNSVGNATRFCSSDSEWGEVNVLNCISREFILLEEMLANVMFSDLEPEKQISIVADVIRQLIQATEPRNNSLLPRDLGVSARIITAVVDVLENNNASNNDVIEIFNNVLDDSNREGWRSLQSAGLMKSSELLLSSAERYATITITFANISGEQTLRQSRLNIVVVGEQYEKPPTTDLQFPLADDLINYTQIDNSSTIKIPSTVIQERLNVVEDDGKIPVVFLLLHNLPMGFSAVNASTTSCTGEEVRTQGATDVLSAQVGSRSKNVIGLQYAPVKLNFTFVTTINSTLESYRCVSWNFSEPIGNGSWITAGITTDDVVTEGNLTILTCRSTHLTSFAVLVDVVGGLGDIDVVERIALQAVSYVGCTISIVCLIVTAIFFVWLNYDQRRSSDTKRVKSAQNFVHLNFSLSLLLALIIYVVGIETATGSVLGCALVAGLLHYLFLCAFCWMLCEGIMLYLLLRVVFSEMSKKWWPFMLIGYLIPLPIVAISVGIRYEYYGVKDSCGELLYCWMSVDKGTIFGFVAPMLVIILINVVFMALALQALWRVKKNQYQKKNENKFQDSQRLGRTLLVASLILLPLLGLTWAFGTLTVNANSTVVAWLFTICNSLQGMFIFFFHVVRNDKIWNKISPKLHSLRTKLTSVSGQGAQSSADGVGTLGSTTKSSGTESKEDAFIESTMDSPSTTNPESAHADIGSKLY